NQRNHAQLPVKGSDLRINKNPPGQHPGVLHRIIFTTTEGTMYEGNQAQPKDIENEKVNQQEEEPAILEDICVEELAIDGICGVY
ncbi:MAG: variant-type mycofactocin precursor, partial [Desulforhopalus sp.]